MLLAIDVGNSQVTLGLGAQEGWDHRWLLETRASGTADEYGVMVADLFEISGVQVGSVSAAVLTCVVPSLTPVFGLMVRRLFGCEALVVGPGSKTGMQVLYSPPSSLGSDRLVDALAARHRYGAPVVAVDFGTATTFNVVDASGAFAGGAIAPGVGTAAYALAEAGARLRHVDLTVSAGSEVIGKNTADGMRAGVVYGYADLVSGLLERFDADLGISDPGQMPVVATGGMAQIIAPLVDRMGEVDPDLTLDGLRLVAMTNGVFP